MRLLPLLLLLGCPPLHNEGPDIGKESSPDSNQESRPDSDSEAVTDQDGDGFDAVEAGGTDCDDSNAEIHPDAPELCNGIDDNCDQIIDTDASDAPFWYRDVDQDTFGDSTVSLQSCEFPTGYTSDNTDCNDIDATINPNAMEVCDGLDNNCDTLTDDADPNLFIDSAQSWYQDSDGDGHGDPNVSQKACIQPEGYVLSSSDCQPDDPLIHPDAMEVCDGIDNDCDALIDDSDPSVFVETSWYPDADGDGYGDASGGAVSCTAPANYLADGSDCNDGDPAVNPAAAELCDELDNDCNSLVDDDDPGLNLGSALVWYLDADGDGFGSQTQTRACVLPVGYSVDTGDCNDADASINPVAQEECDSASTDEDCDGLAEDDDPSAVGQTTFYQDRDGDGFGNLQQPVAQCVITPDLSTDSTDCDDGNASISPAATESCDELDNDCDGSVDEGVASTWYRDVDGDGYGTSTSSTQACSQPSGYSATDTDCNDQDSRINPAATEICGDTDDNNCDGSPNGCYPAGTIDPVNSGYTKAAILGLDQYGYLGSSQSWVPDIDGDGKDEALVSAPGENGNYGNIYLFGGSQLSGWLSTMDARLKLTGVQWETGYGVSQGDMDGDGVAELIIASNYDGILLMDATQTGTVSTDCASSKACLYSTNYPDGSGGMASIGDFTGDGIADFITGDNAIDYNGSDSGTAYLLTGPIPTGSTYLPNDPNTVVLYGGSSDRAGHSCTPGDLDGDGQDEVVVDAWGYGNWPGGGAYVYFGGGSFSSGSLYSSADQIYYSNNYYDYLGCTQRKGGDLNGDGYNELILGAPGDDSNGNSAGMVYVITGYSTMNAGYQQINEARWSAYTILYGLSDSQLGYGSVEIIGDLNQNGTDDLGIYAPNDSQGGWVAGALWVVTEFSSSYSAVISSVATTLVLGSTGDELGRTSPVGDGDGDGLPDLLIGSRLAGVNNEGAVFILPGAGF